MNVPIMTVFVSSRQEAEDLILDTYSCTLQLESTGALQCLNIHPKSTEQCWLILTIHHIAYDGMSFWPLIGDFASGYTSAMEGRVLQHDDLPVQYFDWAEWYRQHLQWDPCDGQMHGSRLKQGLLYWQKVLNDGELPVLGLSANKNSGSHVQQISKVHLSLSAALKGLAQLYAATPMHTSLALWSALLCTYTGQSEVVIGVPFANREHPQLESLIGCFVNTFAVKLVLERQDLRIASVAASRAVMSGVSHANVPFQRVVQALSQLDRSIASLPVYQTLFLWEEGFHNFTSHQDIAMLGINVLHIAVHQAAATDIDLHLSPSMVTGRLEGHMAYDAALYDETMVILI